MGHVRDQSLSPVDGHVLTDVTNDCDYDKEEFEREKLMWEAWREDQRLQLRWKLQRLQDRQKQLEVMRFPCFEDWHRNCQLAKATEGGLRCYTNDEDFHVGPLGGVRQQMLGREMKRTLEQAAGYVDEPPGQPCVQAICTCWREGISSRVTVMYMYHVFACIFLLLSLLWLQLSTRRFEDYRLPPSISNQVDPACKVIYPINADHL